MPTKRITEGDLLELSVTEQNEEPIVQSDELPIRLVDPLDESDIEDGVVTVAVEKTIFTTSDELQMVFVSPKGTGTETARSEEHSREGTKNPPNSPQCATSACSQNSADNGLREIAEDLIGDKDLIVSEEAESVVGAAKDHARDQQRDPAIDPRFSHSTDSE